MPTDSRVVPDFANILVINFGQMGDVILSLPALAGVRKRFLNSKITLLVGKPAAAIASAANVADEQIVVDRVELRDGNKLRSVATITKLIRQVRLKRFDLVIDLHSLPETNLLGFISGSKYRLYANRGNRSLDRLARFPVSPPKIDRSKHLTDQYFDVLRPLGIDAPDGTYRFPIPREAEGKIRKRLAGIGFAGKRIIGIAIGAGHLSRRWALDNFAELARRALTDDRNAVAVFLGPEEREIADEVRRAFPADAVIFDDLSLVELLAACSLVSAFVTNDSGPAHIAGIAGASVVIVMDERAPLTFLPLGSKIEVIRNAILKEITVDDVAAAVARVLG